MLFQVEMTVKLPPDMAPERAAEIKAREKDYAQELQRSGKWRHLWRVAGSYSNVSVFDVADNAELQELVSNLPLFPYMEIRVKPLCRHPSSIRDDDS
ncbi:MULTISPECIES: muconolactone Delta-isomerase [Halomonas]|jgi:muconolactone D-isomerase|uniref:Muconolactone Delta-isomerase n=3 Tax=Halomonas TaxID=2745 RepID=A0AAU7KIS5_9GAMM|nr:MULTISPECIES: muconolactone Delta-isomerase [Halomonas]MBR9771361.1 muconolactone Delta-isomerase [Gammaproteobacteria bacterium]KJZ17527.1 muconolactone delta-isomerase [Halomonas sp. S2151]MAR72622.1 muconolactone delta-isomerase [Halomonas sp.]MAY69938.1 muconolactone delta-isomerase [Halomonas sp.]MBR9878114.1 muconolactone Delta-isomerase [Gammaproteobacteria bacterium]|tara:strand:+ start:282 stop:572 length:291 start_codon:yes stop_codon:yes gene_type:complete